LKQPSVNPDPSKFLSLPSKTFAKLDFPTPDEPFEEILILEYFSLLQKSSEFRVGKLTTELTKSKTCQK